MRVNTVFISIIISIICTSISYAQPYGRGTYSSGVPYGSQTSLSIATSGDINVPITPTDNGTLATSNSDITVTSTDVTGYKLYIRALNYTHMNNLGAILPATTNEEPAPLSNNSWGYNTDKSNNFIGMTLNDTLLYSTTMPATSGETTKVTYGIKVDMEKPAGNYVANVVYTAVPQTD